MLFSFPAWTTFICIISQHNRVCFSLKDAHIHTHAHTHRLMLRYWWDFLVERIIKTLVLHKDDAFVALYAPHSVSATSSKDEVKKTCCRFCVQL